VNQAVNQTRYTLPESVGNMLSKLPSYPGSLMFVLALNLALKARIPEDVQRSLEGKRLRIAVSDAKVAFDFTWKRGGFVADWDNGGTDLTISASAHDFLLLAQRKEDPDTLFFSRRLSMEGDTELGLIVKNTLDAIDLSVFELAKKAPSQILQELKSRLKFPK
jgi:O2-independent ubiquinone biosynthesis accessory factor UbiT